jgi:hypothetical protein
VEFDFAVNGAPGKLEGLSLLRRQQERLFVSPLDGAIANCKLYGANSSRPSAKPPTDDEKTGMYGQDPGLVPSRGSVAFRVGMRPLFD